jgi:hypothetical protein
MDPTLALQPLDALDRPQLVNTLASVGVRLDAAPLDNLMRAMSATRAELYGLERLDANETVLFGQQLEFISARLRDIKRPELKWRNFVPVTSEVPPGAETWAYYTWDSVGMAEIVANYADDIRRVATSGTKQTFGIETYALGYDWSVLDIERAAMAGVNYRNRKADAVRRGFELRFERVASVGQLGVNIKGLLNNANVPLTTAASVGGSTVWGSAGKSANDVLTDLMNAEDAILNLTKGIETPDTMLMSLAKFRYLQHTPLFTGAGSNPKDTILSVFLERSDYIRNVDWWHPLATADVAGTGPRLVMYRRDPEHEHLEMPMAPRELPPQPEGLAVAINSWTRLGGVVFEYPLSALYVDGI